MPQHFLSRTEARESLLRAAQEGRLEVSRDGALNASWEIDGQRLSGFDRRAGQGLKDAGLIRFADYQLFPFAFVGTAEITEAGLATLDHWAGRE